MNFLYLYIDQILQFFFPDQCIICSKGQKMFCYECLNSIRYLNNQECPNCFCISEEGRFCDKCCKNVNSSLDFLLVGASYKSNKVLSAIIKSTKYRKMKRSLDLLPSKIFQALLCFNKNSILVPIPLNIKRKKERGFNQSEILCSKISSIFDLPIINDLLIRNRYTKPQAELNKIEREQNLKDAFQINIKICSEKFLKYQIVLVDDVSSTRSTLEECAKVLRSAGFTKVGGFVLARK